MTNNNTLAKVKLQWFILQHKPQKQTKEIRKNNLICKFHVNNLNNNPNTNTTVIHIKLWFFSEQHWNYWLTNTLCLNDY